MMETKKLGNSSIKMKYSTCSQVKHNGSYLEKDRLAWMSTVKWFI